MAASVNKNYFQDLEKYVRENGGDEEDFLKSEIERFESELKAINPCSDQNDTLSLIRNLRIAEKKSSLEDLIFEYSAILKRFSTEAKARVKLVKNTYTDIFSNDLGQALFFELHNIYKSKKYHLANYSFVFYALQKEYLVCNGVNFIKFLSTHNIDIDKIDSRQSGNKTKEILFNSILEKLSN